MPFISSFEIIKVVVFEVDPESIAEEAAVKPNNPSGFTTDFSNGNPGFNKGPRNLPKNPADCIIFSI